MATPAGGGATTMSPEETSEHILALMRAHGESDYIGERVSQLEHALQAAHLAAAASAGPETVLAALLHDIGQLLPPEEVQQTVIQDMRPAPSSTAAAAAAATGVEKASSSEGGAGARPDSGSVGRVGHETLGAQYLAAHGFSRQVCALVGSHVAAKRYICATEPGYHENVLSEASKASLRLQGGPMSAAEVQQWEQSPWAADMARLRKWDDAAKVPGLAVKNLDGYRALMNDHLRSQSLQASSAAACS